MVIEWVKEAAFKRGLKDPNFFRSVLRPAAYSLAKGDPERVHEMALEALNAYERSVEEVAGDFDVPELCVDIKGHRIMPFGTAAGLDKNGDALSPLSCIFGFLEPGTVVINERPGNDRPRVAVDMDNGNLYNAQGFPSRGMDYFVEKVATYWESGGKAPLYLSICGIPSGDDTSVAMKETETLLEVLNPYADGFVWNPFSPNTAALTKLRTPETFKEYAKLFRGVAGDKLKQAKIGPYDDKAEKRHESLSLVEGWMKGGGDGVVAVNTYMVQKEQVPSETWGYPTAGRSGKSLGQYRQRAVRDVRQHFPEAIIFATGGISNAQDAFEAFQAGADALEGYTVYTFNGFGALYNMVHGLKRILNERGYETLSEFKTKSRSKT